MTTADKDDATRQGEAPGAGSQPSESRAENRNESEPEAGTNEASAKHEVVAIPTRELLPLPGLGAIALYLLVLSGVIILGVVGGGHYPKIFLIFSAVFLAASAGLMLLLRWAWALALTAVLLLGCYHFWIFASFRQGPSLVQGLLNLVFFLYMIRSEVRERLR
jgi:hypothetical protein